MAFFVGCCRFGLAGVLISVWINHAKMFPTLFVATSMGISNIIARVIVIAAPIVAEVTFPIPVIVFTALNVLAGASSLFLVDHESSKSDNEERK